MEKYEVKTDELQNFNEGEILITDGTGCYYPESDRGDKDKRLIQTSKLKHLQKLGWFDTVIDVEVGDYAFYPPHGKELYRVVELDIPSGAPIALEPVGKDGPELGWVSRKDMRKATDEQVEKYLRDEFVNRYDPPCRVKYFDKGEGKLIGYSCKYLPEDDTLTVCGDNRPISRSGVVYLEGEWAEPLPDKWQVGKKSSPSSEHGFVVTSDNREVNKFDRMFIRGFTQQEAEAVADALNEVYCEQY